MCLLSFPSGCVVGHLVRREKRFFVHAVVDGLPVVAHTNNTGSMLGLLREGAAVLLSPAQNPERKLRWTLECIWSEGVENKDSVARRGCWVGVNTSVPNRLLEAAFHAGALPWAAGYTVFRREQKNGESRLDALLEGPGLPRLWVECKSVTLADEGVARFPDAVSTRGLKHLETLRRIVATGERAAMFYCVQRGGVAFFGPAGGIDPDYAAGLRAAQAAGVEVYPHQVVFVSFPPVGMGLAPECLPVV